MRIRRRISRYVLVDATQWTIQKTNKMGNDFLLRPFNPAD